MSRLTQELRDIKSSNTVPNVVLLIGDGSSGKTYSLRNLNPDRTTIVQCTPAPKSLDWFGSGKYKFGENVFHEPHLIPAFNRIVDVCKAGRDVVIDDVYYLAYTKYTILSEDVDSMQNQRDAVFAMYRALGREQYAIFRPLEHMHPGTKGVIIYHDELYKQRIISRQIGSMNYNRSKAEEQFSIVLYSDRLWLNGKTEYVFLTRDNAVTPAKSPPEMFPTIIPNDMQLVFDRIEEYRNEVFLKDSKLDFGNYDADAFIDALHEKAEVLAIRDKSLRAPTKEKINLNKSRR